MAQCVIRHRIKLCGIALYSGCTTEIWNKYINTVYVRFEDFPPLDTLSVMSWNLGHVKRLPTKITLRLAPEIYDNILVNFHDSKHHLSNFSVVSNLWLSLCRYYLFAEVTYRANFSLFLALSAHAVATIVPYIKELKIDGNILTDIDKSRIMEFIFSLPNLRSLCFNNMDIHAMKLHHLFAEGIRYLRLGLCSLNLRLTHFSTFGVLTDFLKSFSALEELSLENVSWDRLRHIPDRQEESARDSVIGPSSLRRLKIDFCDNITLLNWLQYGVISDSLVDRKSINHRSFSHLRTLSVTDILPAETKVMNSFLSTLDNTLEELEIGLIMQYHTGPHNQGKNFF